MLILRPEWACCCGRETPHLSAASRCSRKADPRSQPDGLIAQGVIAPEQAETHSQANVITRAVGAASELDLDSRIEPLETGDMFLLCSDGLYRSVADAEMADILAQAAEALLALSLSRQPTDNVTLGVVQSADADVVFVKEPLFTSPR